MGKEHNPDAGFRLLALFRYWNIINYFFPYKHLTDKNWDSVLKEYIPSFIKATDRLEYELTFVRLLVDVCDSHTFLNDGWDRIESLKGSKQVPVIVKFIKNRLVVMEVENTGLRRGDIITHIEGKSVETIVDSMKQYYPASNEVSKMRAITSEIFRTNKDYIQIDYISSGKMKQKDLYTENRGRWLRDLNNREDTAQCYRIIGKDIGYINLKTITKKDIPVIKKELINTKGIIIDIRNYPPDVYNLLAPYFVHRTISFSKLTKGNPDNPGEFVFLPDFKIPVSEEYYKGKLAVIVNEETISNAEYSTMAFRTGGQTMVIGSQTGGVNGNISEITLPGGLSTCISGNGVFYPDGKETQRVGIVPDIEIKPTIQGIREGRDELLEQAIEIINQK
jgi:C-terminal processing protease CtpA/Prc